MSRKVPADLITQAEAARLRGVTPEAISDLIRRGRLTTYDVAGNKLVRQNDVEGFEKKRAGRPSKKRSGKKAKG